MQFKLITGIAKSSNPLKNLGFGFTLHSANDNLRNKYNIKIAFSVINCLNKRILIKMWKNEMLVLLKMLIWTKLHVSSFYIEQKSLQTSSWVIRTSHYALPTLYICILYSLVTAITDVVVLLWFRLILQFCSLIILTV